MKFIVNSFKETHQSFDLVGHEILIVFNVVHFALYTYYLVYETFSKLLNLCGYPHLPIQVYFDSYFSNVVVTSWFNTTLKVLSLLGSLLGMFGSSNWLASLTIVSVIICLPFVIYDLILLLTGNFHQIDIDDFLLFQTLFISAIRTVRILATSSNIIMLAHLSLNIPGGANFSDFL